MNSKKGLTLIEVLLSISLIGLIATAFFPAIWLNFSMMIRAKSITQNIFIAKQNMEKAVEIAKGEDSSKYDSRFSQKSFSLFGKIVDGILINQPISGDNKIIVYIPKVSVPVHEIPTIKNDSVKILPSGPIYGFKLGENLTGSKGILEDNKNYYMSIYNWYLSRPGFEGFVPDKTNSLNEGEFSKRYPQWPQDYIKIKTNYNTPGGLSNLNSYVDDYQGRHIVYSVIPVSTIGKYGIEISSKPVYLVGLPILNPSLHLNVDTIQEEIIEENELIWSDTLNDNIKTDKKIKIKYNEANGKFAEFKGMKTTLSNSPTLGGNITVFVVFNNNSLEENKTQNIINSNNGWKFDINNGKVEFLIGKEGNQIKIVSETSINNQKHILVGQIIEGTNGKVKLFVDNEEKDFMGSTNNYRYNSSLNLSIADNNSELNMYEIIIYNSALSEEDINKVMRYLSEKIELP